jgi:tetratricopeptide (TPR) repeat protein
MPCLDESTFMKLMLGDLAPERAAEVERHLDECPSCRRLVAEALRARTPVSDSLATTLIRHAPHPPAEATLQQGTPVGRYVVKEWLGAGGMGVVYSAHDPELDRRVALKLLRVGALGLDAQEGRAHLLREAQAMARVSHPHVVSVYDVGTFGEQVFLAMEYVEARTLRQWLRERPRSWREVRDVFVDAGKGLLAAHAVGLVHGDFKPENLLVGRDGRVRVTDFGLARRITPGDTAELVGGTPAYMAPERFGRDGHADVRSDQFAFCVALYEALHGERPFAGDTPRELMAEVRSGRVRPAPRGTSVPPWLHRLVVRGLEVDPAARHPSMEALLTALQRDPSERRRTWLRLGGALALLLLSVGLTHALHVRASRVCEGAEEKVAAIWGPEQKQAAEEAFLATGRPFAAGAWKSARRTLDAYTATWATLHTAACEATRVRGEQSEEMLGRRMRCLDQRLAEVTALARLFTQADANVVQHAPRTAEQLPPLSGCSDLEALAAEGPLPADEAARRPAESLHEAMVAGRMLGAAGRYAEGVARLQPAVETARAAGNPSSGAEALLLMAELYDRAGDYRGAEKAIQEAGWAAEAGHNDAVAARAWTLAVRIAGERLEKYVQAHLWRERAESSLARLGDDEVLRARLLNNVGRVLSLQGQYDEAAKRQQEALRLIEKAQGPEGLEVADVLIELGSTRVSQGQQDEALALLRRARALREQVLGPSHPEVGQALLALADGFWQYRDFQESARLSHQAVEILESALGPRHPLVGHALNHYAMTQLFNPKVDRGEIMALLERSLQIVREAEGPESTNSAYLAGNIAQVLMAQRRIPEAERYFRDAIAQVEARQGPNHPPLTILLSGLGQTLQAQGRAEEALASFERAVALQLAQPHDYRNFGAELLMNLGMAYFQLRRPQDAVPPLERALLLLEQAPPRFVRHREIVRFRLARALWDSGRERERARRLITEALGMLSQDQEPGVPQLRANLEHWLTAHPLGR